MRVFFKTILLQCGMNEAREELMDLKSIRVGMPVTIKRSNGKTWRYVVKFTVLYMRVSCTHRNHELYELLYCLMYCPLVYFVASLFLLFVAMVTNIVH